MSTPQLQMLLNKHDNNHLCHALQTLVYMHGFSFKKQIFIEVVKANKVIMMKICSFSLKDPNN
jgi:hypothetical protein